MCLRIEIWFGQVGSETQTRTCGLAIFSRSNPCRTAPVPPGVATLATASRGTAPPRTSATIASLKPGSPASPV